MITEMDERSTPNSFGRSSGMDTGDSTNMAMVVQAGSIGQASSVELSQGASSGSALESTPQRGVTQRTEEARISNVATNGQQEAHTISVPRSVSDAGSNGGESGRPLSLSNQFEALGDVRSRSRSPGAGNQTPKKTSGCVTPSSVIVGRSGRSTPKSGGGSNFGKSTFSADQRIDREILQASSPGGRSSRSDRQEGVAIHDLLSRNIPEFPVSTNLQIELGSPGNVHGGSVPALGYVRPDGVSPSGIVTPGGRSEVSSHRPTPGGHVSMMMVPQNPGGSSGSAGGALETWKNPASWMIGETPFHFHRDPDGSMTVEDAWRYRQAKRALADSSSGGEKRAITSFVPPTAVNPLSVTLPLVQDTVFQSQQASFLFTT